MLTWNSHAWRRILLLAALSLCSTLLFSQNATSTAAYGNCPAPTSAGVHVCWPVGTEIGSPVQVIASATGAGGPVNHIELWDSGKKVTQSPGSLFDKPVQLSTGPHRLTLVEVDSTGAHVNSTPLTLTVDYNSLPNQCAAPGMPGVNVCIPAYGSCHTAGYTTVVAAGTGASGTVARMELWVNGVKLANFPGSTINTNLYLPDYDKLTIVEVDSKGAYVKSQTITILSC